MRKGVNIRLQKSLFFKHSFVDFGLNFGLPNRQKAVQLGGTKEGKKGEKRRMAARRVPEGFWEPFWTPFWVDLGPLGAPLGAIWSLWGLSWDSFWPPEALFRLQEALFRLLGLS